MTSTVAAPLVRKPVSRRTNIYLPIDLVAWGHQYADEHLNRSFSEFVAHLLAQKKASWQKKARNARKA